MWRKVRYKNCLLYTSLGGRAAEKLVLDDISTGASNDLEAATNIARDMITVYGMSDTIGPISLKDSENPNQMILYGEKMQDAIGAEIKILIDTAYRNAQKPVSYTHLDVYKRQV